MYLDNGLVNQTVYNVNMIPFSVSAIDALIEECLIARPVSKKQILNVPASFDTETTSFIDDVTNEETSLCYIWMFGINETVVYGRTLDEFRELIKKVNDYLISVDNHLVVYVHFFKFDFSFIKFVLNWDKVFMKENRDVLFAVTGNIEFRDSLVLSGGQSLYSIGQKLRRDVKKAAGDLDYSLIRHTKTPLTQRELHYCEYDIRTLNEYIREKIEDDGDISQIPYTNTGYVRNYVRKACFKNRNSYSAFIAGLTMTPDCYMQAESAFTGGSVAPHMGYVEKVCKNVHSYDIKSSYPYVMCTGYYPINYFEPVPGLINGESLVNQTKLKQYTDNYCCLFTLEMWDVVPLHKFYFPISKHKCLEVLAPVCDNDNVFTASGRIISAMYLRINVTELDFDTITKFYDCSKFRVSRLRISPRGYLPYPIVRSVLKFFFDKTTLDGVEGKEREYMIAKNMLNAVYGMMVEKPIRPVFGFVNDVGFTKEEADFVEQIDSYNEKFNRFLFYPWGIWVTAHARYRLHDAILEVGDDFRYCDTDSVKFVGDHSLYFGLVNQTAVSEMKRCAERMNLAIEHVNPIAPDGSVKVLGVWEHEWDAHRFKTLGAKRYMVDYSWTEKGNKYYEPGTKISLTTSGLKTNSIKPEDKDGFKYLKKYAKENGIDIFDAFNTSLVIPEDYAGRTISKFIDSERSGWVTDYLGTRAYYYSPSGLYVANSTYSFSMTDEMKDAVMWITGDAHYTDGEM